MTFAPASAALGRRSRHHSAGSPSTPLHLRTAADASLRQVDELITKSSEHLELVKQLERNLDATEGNPLDLGQIPTADELGAELERYLRGERTDHRPDSDPGSRPGSGIEPGPDLEPGSDVELGDGPLLDWDSELTPTPTRTTKANSEIGLRSRCERTIRR